MARNENCFAWGIGGCKGDVVFVFVYKYRYWDDELQKHMESDDMFTLEAIRAGLGTAIHESAVGVQPEDVDESGRLTNRDKVPVRNQSLSPQPSRS